MRLSQRPVIWTAFACAFAAAVLPANAQSEKELPPQKPIVREQLTVVADAPANTKAATLKTVVTNEQVLQLPLNGRSFVALTALAPGVALPPNSAFPRVNGGRPRTNEFLFDGISVLQPEPGQVAYLPVIDAIKEFTIVSNSAPAEFGRFNGGVVSVTTKAGSNDLHGDVFEFARHEKLNARNFFQSTNPVKPKYRRSQFGGTLGGPVVRGRTFFFADAQVQRQGIGRTVTSTVPTLLQRQGIFTESVAGRIPAIFDPATGATRSPFADNTIPVNRIDPIALALVQRYPLPTLPGTANNYSRTADEIDKQRQWDARLDHHLATNRDAMFGRLTYFHDDFTPVTPLPDGSGATTGTLGPQGTTSWALAGNYQHTVSGSMLNEVRVGQTQRKVARSAVDLPTYVIGGYQQLGAPPNTVSDFQTGVFEAADTLTWVTGRHAIRTGFDWRWERLNVFQPPSPYGSYTFNTLGSDQPGVTSTGNALASFLLGQVQNFSIDVQTKKIQERAHFREYFVQDDWKVSNRLTLSSGLRYTLNFPSTEINGQTAVFNLQTQQLEYPGAKPVRPLKKDNFGPRMGAVFGINDKTIVSSAYGLIWIEMAGITTPFTTPTFPFLQTVTQRALDTTSPAFVLKDGPTVSPLSPMPTAGLGQGVFAVDKSLGSGYAQQWNLSLQREIAANTSVEGAYVGSIITHVGIPDTNLNQLSASQLALGQALLEKVPNPFFGTIPRSSSLGDPTITVAQLMKPYPQYTTVSLYRNNVGTTRYQGLELSVRHRFARGLSYSASYTRSKLIDDASSVFDASILTGPVANYPVADSFNRKLERDYSTGDTPHVFVSSVVWDVRKHWTVAMLATLQSGMPIAVTQATNFNAFAGFGTQRPNLVGDPRLPAGERTPAHWFNTAAFAVAPQFTLGSASRNPVRGPAYHDVDLSVIRRVPLTGSKTVELRAEIFNLLNTTNFGAPNGTLGSAAFGTITTALDPRVVQLAAKFLF